MLKAGIKVLYQYINYKSHINLLYKEQYNQYKLEYKKQLDYN